VSNASVSPEFLQGLQEAQETFRHLVEGIPAILYIDAVDDLSSNIYTSPQITEILGFSPDEWRDDPGFWVARLHEDDRERAVRESLESNRTGEPFRCEYRIIAADGHEVWFRDEAVLVRTDAGQPLFWRGVMFDITEQKRAEEKLRRSLEVLHHTMEDRRHLITRLEEAQEEERRRIAADIHDDSIQVIGAADLRAQALARRLADAELRHEATELHETLALAIERLRHLLFELRPPALDRDGLVAALRVYLEHQGPDRAVAFEIDDELAIEPPPEVRATLFRIAQEAITNARKHAGASLLRVSVATHEGGVLVRVSDDGRGFDAIDVGDPAPGHIGMPAMIERAELAGGWCRVHSAPGEGTTIEAWLPLGWAVQTRSE